MERHDVEQAEADDGPDPGYAPPALEDLGSFSELTQLSTGGAFDGEGSS